MTEEKQELVRDYLRDWTEADWTLLDDLYNDGVSLPEALVLVHRAKQELPAPIEREEPGPSESIPIEQLLRL